MIRRQGRSISVDYMVQNRGDQPDACINLAPGESFSQTRSVQIPADTTLDSYYVGVFADIDEHQAESLEDNNFAGSALTVGCGQEVCDGLDNDCDGDVDEENPGGGASRRVVERTLKR